MSLGEALAQAFAEAGPMSPTRSLGLDLVDGGLTIT